MNHSNSKCMPYPRFRIPLLIALSVILYGGAIGEGFAVGPPPGEGYPNDVTALGDGALSKDNPDSDNTGLGFEALKSVTSAGIYNTAVGSMALLSNTSSYSNVAVGFQPLAANTTGIFNVAMGQNALIANTAGGYNVAIGEEALQAHIEGFDNVAVGPGAMVIGTSGDYNVAVGSTAMAFFQRDRQRRCWIWRDEHG